MAEISSKMPVTDDLISKVRIFIVFLYYDAFVQSIISLRGSVNESPTKVKPIQTGQRSVL